MSLMKLPSWNNAPEYRYKGYVYMPHIDEGEDCVKVYHEVFFQQDLLLAERKNSNAYAIASMERSPYSFVSREDFEGFIDGRIID